MQANKDTRGGGRGRLHNVHDQAAGVIIASVLLEVLRLAGLIPTDRDTASSLSFSTRRRGSACGPKAGGLLTWLFATQPRGYQPRRTAGGLSAPPGRSRRLQRGIQRRRSARRRRRRSRGPPAWQLRGQTPPMAGPGVTNRRRRGAAPGGTKIYTTHVCSLVGLIIANFFVVGLARRALRHRRREQWPR